VHKQRVHPVRRPRRLAPSPPRRLGPCRLVPVAAVPPRRADGAAPCRAASCVCTVPAPCVR